LAISVDWGTKVISVNKVDMVLVQSVPSEIYELDLDVFRLALGELLDDETGMAFPDTHNYFPPLSVGGASLARVIEIINGYTITFEDGQYRAQIVNGNSNIGENVNVNQVSVSTANSAGLQDLGSLQAASFNGGVTVNTSSSYTGTTFPVGTRQTPVNNMADALTIANERGLKVIYLASSITLSSEDATGHEFIGDSAVVNTCTIDAGANVSNCTFKNLTIMGTLDNANILRECSIGALSSLNGFIFQCALGDTITLGGNAQTTIMSCYSGVAGALTPVIDMGGSGQALVLRDYSGGIKITNKTGNDNVSIDLTSGHVILDSTVSDGAIIVRGSGKITNSATGTAVVDSLNLITGDKFTNIAHMVESKDPTTTKYGNVYYVDPINGSDTNVGTDPARGFATISGALSKTTPNNGDIIFLISPGEASIIIDEVVNMNVAGVALRSEKLDVKIKPTATGTPPLTISANYVQIMNLTVEPTAGGTDDAIFIDGVDHVVLDKIRVENSTNRGIHVEHSHQCVIRNSFIGYSASHGIQFDDCQDVDVNECHIDTNGGDNLKFTSTGVGNTHEVIIRKTIIHEASGYGANIGTNCETIQFLDGCKFILNGTDILDNGITTFIEDTTGLTESRYVELSQSLKYDGHVHVDANNGVAGTTYPLGVYSSPVSNIADALVIAAANNISKIQVLEDITILATDDVSGFEIEGSHPLKSEITVAAGATTTFTEFSNCNLIGTLNGDVIVKDCTIGDLANFSGIVYGSTFSGTITLIGTKAVHFLDCYSAVPGSNTPSIDFNSANTPLTIRAYSGGIKLENKTTTAALSIDMLSGQVIVDGSVTAGDILVRGQAKLTDNSNGTAVVDSSSLIEEQGLTKKQFLALK